MTQGHQGWPYNTERWRKLRKVILQRDPICKRCDHAPSTMADHVTPWKDGGEVWCPSNLRGLCNRCHQRVSRVQQGERGTHGQVTKPFVRVPGCDAATGMPLDPDHEWNA